jgi:hypothetical protein
MIDTSNANLIADGEIHTIEKEDHMKNIYVGNLSFDTTEGAVRTVFEEYGTVCRVNIFTDRQICGFVEMNNDGEGETAIAALNGRNLDGRVLNVIPGQWRRPAADQVLVSARGADIFVPVLPDVNTTEQRGVNMSTTLVEVRPLVKLLDEAVWEAWLDKGRAQDRRSSAARLKAIILASIAGLVAVFGLWSHLTPYDALVRFMLTIGAIVAMFHAIYAGKYVFAVLFGVIALLYNPIAPVFSFSGGWQRAIVLVSAAPFVASLAWRSLSASSSRPHRSETTRSCRSASRKAARVADEQEAERTKVEKLKLAN